MITMVRKKPFLSTQDKIIRFIFGIVVFSGLVSGGTYYLQSSLLIYKGLGNYAHWGIILILLPAVSGMIQHLIAPPARLIVNILGALLTSIILYPFYAENFWASPPSITDTIVFTLAIAGIGYTCSINPLDRHIHQRKSSSERRKSSQKNQSHPRHLSHKDSSSESMLNSSFVRSFELMLTALSFFLAIWGTFFLGSSSMN